MKIAILHMTLGLVNRGSEVSTDLIAQALSQKNHQLSLIHCGKLPSKPYNKITLDTTKTAPNPAPQNLIQKVFFRLGFNQNSHKVTRFTQQAIPHLQKLNSDIIIPVNGSNQLNMVKAHLPHSKTVVFGRAGIGHHDQKNLRQKPDLFIALTPKAKIWAKKHAAPQTKITYIPNPIDSKHFKNAKPAKINLKKPIVLTVAAFTDYKNIQETIKAVAKTPASHLIIGSGKQEEQIQKFARKLLPNRHKIFTNLKPSNLPPYYKASDVFCFIPDKQEAFGRVYLEAMSAGLPIVATKDHIRKGILGKQGFFTNPHQTKKTAKLIQKALDSKKPNYQKQLKKFSIEKISDQIEKELEILVKT